MGERRVQVAGHVAKRTVDGLALLFNAETGQYFGLDQIGTRVWDLIAMVGDLDEIQAVLLSEYNAEPDDVRRDLDAIVATLRARGLVHFEPA